MPDDARGESAVEHMLYVVNRLARALNRAAEDIAADAGVTLPELMALLVLGEGVPLSNAQLARRTFVTSQASHQVVTQLTRRGLLARTADPANRRLVLQGLSEEGWAVVEACRRELAVLESRVLDGLPPEARGELVPLLLDAAQTLKGGWFGDEAAEAASTARRSTGERRRREA